MKLKFSFIHLFVYTALLSSLTMISCNKYLDTPLPSGTISEDNVYVSDNSISSVVTNFYLSMQNSGLFVGSRNGNLACTMGLYTDELTNPEGNTANIPFYLDAIEPANFSGAWSNLYSKLYAINSAIEGINGTSAALFYKNQWLGECYFNRALCYFYLTTLYGDVPLPLTSNYATNNVLPRTPQSQVYGQIISDLKQAQSLLGYGYSNGFAAPTANRLRPNRYAATALLARAYLYDQKWDSAEIQVDTVLARRDLYKLLPLSQVFAINSAETIWALAPTTGSLTVEYQLYNNGMPATIPSGKTLGSYSTYLAMSNQLVNAFEPNDNRFTTWVRSSTTSATPAVTWYFPNKYSSATVGGQNDILLRVSELFLIRAEARAHQNKYTDAANDIDSIRIRAGLPVTTAATQTDLLTAIAHERQVEMFTEFANRFLDLKRTGAIDSVMAIVAPLKGAAWSSYMALWPIPTNDLIQDPNLSPNPGYVQ